MALGAGAGLACGVAFAILLARSLQNVAPVDVATAATAVAIIATVGLAAAIVPALRVRRVDPAQVLRG
jgi:ABC-type antimicrobial peptide transport system permease subunit